jgi:cytochrome c oxidase subunit 4
MTTSHAHSMTDAHGDDHNHGPSVGQYFLIFIALLVLLFLSVGVAYIKSEHRTLLTLVGFTIAAIKGLLIILFFMHVKFGSRLTWLFAFSSFFFLLIMVWLTMNDYGTRQDVVTGETHFSQEGGNAFRVENTRIHAEPSDTK